MSRLYHTVGTDGFREGGTELLDHHCTFSTYYSCSLWSMINQVRAVKTCEEIITHSGSAKSAGHLTFSFPLSSKNSSKVFTKNGTPNRSTKREIAKMMKEKHVGGKWSTGGSNWVMWVGWKRNHLAKILFVNSDLTPYFRVSIYPSTVYSRKKKKPTKVLFLIWQCINKVEVL